MKYQRLGKTEAVVSRIALGGHEYLPDKRSRGFNEDLAKAVTPGYLFDGFGGEERKKVLKAAFDHGINFLDVTMDSEKEALGRNLEEVPPPYPVFIQTRPEGFVYTYDENNAKMAKYDLLKAEVVRILGLLRRERLDFLNMAFMKSALDHDPEYLEKIGANVASLKKEGLIRWACADTFSGESTYLAQIGKGCFDVVYINFNFGDRGAEKRVLPAAAASGLGVIAREAYMKGNLFRMAKEAGIENTGELAHAALKWCLAHEEVTTVVYGTGNVNHLLGAVHAVEDERMTEAETSLIGRIEKTELFRTFEEGKTKEFFQA